MSDASSSVTIDDMHLATTPDCWSRPGSTLMSGLYMHVYIYKGQGHISGPGSLHISL